MGWAQMIGSLVESNSDKYTNVDGTVTTKRNITQEGVDKIIYDILSSDSGLAGLASGENGSGGFNSASKGLLAQDMMVKLAGEIANITAETTQTTQTKQQDDKQSPMGKALGTIICTHIMQRGFVSRRDWALCHQYDETLSPVTILGYQFFAEPIVQHMQKNPNGLVEKFWKSVVQGRYKMIVHGKFNLPGAFSVYAVQPFSFFIGMLIGVPYGRYVPIK